MQKLSVSIYVSAVLCISSCTGLSVNNSINALPGGGDRSLGLVGGTEAHKNSIRALMGNRIFFEEGVEAFRCEGIRRPTEIPEVYELIGPGKASPSGDAICIGFAADVYSPYSKANFEKLSNESVECTASPPTNQATIVDENGEVIGYVQGEGGFSCQMLKIETDTQFVLASGVIDGKTLFYLQPLMRLPDGMRWGECQVRVATEEFPSSETCITYAELDRLMAYVSDGRSPSEILVEYIDESASSTHPAAWTSITQEEIKQIEDMLDLVVASVTGDTGIAKSELAKIYAAKHSFLLGTKIDNSGLTPSLMDEIDPALKAIGIMEYTLNLQSSALLSNDASLSADLLNLSAVIDPSFGWLMANSISKQQNEFFTDTQFSDFKSGIPGFIGSWGETSFSIVDDQISAGFRGDWITTKGGVLETIETNAENREGAFASSETDGGAGEISGESGSEVADTIAIIDPIDEKFGLTFGRNGLNISHALEVARAKQGEGGAFNHFASGVKVGPTDVGASGPANDSGTSKVETVLTAAIVVGESVGLAAGLTASLTAAPAAATGIVIFAAASYGYSVSTADELAGDIVEAGETVMETLGIGGDSEGGQQTDTSSDSSPDSTQEGGSGSGGSGANESSAQNEQSNEDDKETQNETVSSTNTVTTDEEDVVEPDKVEDLDISTPVNPDDDDQFDVITQADLELAYEQFLADYLSLINVDPEWESGTSTAPVQNARLILLSVVNPGNPDDRGNANSGVPTGGINPNQALIYPPIEIYGP